MSVAGQVDFLIRSATDEENLAYVFCAPSFLRRFHCSYTRLLLPPLFSPLHSPLCHLSLSSTSTTLPVLPMTNFPLEHILNVGNLFYYTLISRLDVFWLDQLALRRAS